LISDRFHHLYGETLLLEFSDESLAQYRVSYEPDRRHLRDVVPRQLFEAQYHSPQLPLWELGDGDWLKVTRFRSSRRRLTHTDAICQLELFP